MKSTVTNASNEVGVIGQTYENRVTKKLGVLESRAEKYRTLMLRDEEGKPFNITYGTFKSNWRKYTGESPLKTSTQVKEETEEKEAVEEKVEKKRKEKVEKQNKEIAETVKKAHKGREANMVMCQHIKHVSEETINRSQPSRLLVSTISKGAITICIKNRHFVEMWPKCIRGAFQLCIKDDFYEFAKDAFVAEEFKHADFKENWKLKYNIPNIPVERLEDIVNEIVTHLNAFAETLPNEEKKKVEKEG